MRIALMSDIHGNREAFAACLEHAAQNGIERYVFLGDYAGYGADPGWVIDTVRARVADGAVAVLGNHDAAAAANRTAGMNDVAAAACEYVRDAVSHRPGTHHSHLLYLHTVGLNQNV